jgi:hypothetical protein
MVETTEAVPAPGARSRPAASKTALTKANLLPALLTSGVFAIFASQPSTGLVIFSVVALVPWGLYSLGVIAFSAARRKLQAAKLALWALAFLGSSSWLTYVDGRAVAAADRAVTAVQAHTLKHGRCPKTLDEAGYSQAQYRAAAGRFAFYQCGDGNPFLAYSDPWMIYVTRVYSFEHRTWKSSD